MLKNFFKVAFRNLRREKLYAVVNIVGLAVGLACCILIGLYVIDELSFDRFHEDIDRIYFTGQVEEDHYRLRRQTPYAFGHHLQQTLQGVESVTRIRYDGNPVTRIYVDGQEFVEEDPWMRVDTLFFDFFSFQMLEGDPVKALTEPGSVVITRRAALKYFNDSSPVGETFRLGVTERAITGIVENPPSNSSIQFDFLIPMSDLTDANRRTDSWLSHSYRTYVKLNPSVTEEQIDSWLGSVDEQFGNAYFMRPFRDFYLSEEQGFFNIDYGIRGEVFYVRFFGLTALLILIIACVNYMNLATARATKRTGEVGVRKTFGAGRKQLLAQFLGESLLFSFLGLIIAIILTQLTLPWFNSFFDKQLEFNLFEELEMLAGLIGITLLTGLLSGLYPAWVLSSYKPSSVFQTGTGLLRSGAGIRNLLVTGQFAVAVVLIVGVLVSSRQLNYMNSSDQLGFDGDNVLVVSLPTPGFPDLNSATEEEIEQFIRERSSFSVFKQRALQLPWVTDASASWLWPGNNYANTPSVIAFNPVDEMSGDPVEFVVQTTDENFADFIGLELITGRYITDRFITDSETESNSSAIERVIASSAPMEVVINESAVRALGFESPGDAIGRIVSRAENSSRYNERVVGVVRDFHYQGFQNWIRPVMLQPRSSESVFIPYVGLRFEEVASEQALLTSVQNIVSDMFPGSAFRYSFLDDMWQDESKSERTMQQIFIFFTVIAILLACMGLFSLAAYNVERRVKEIGIRKVLGATVVNIAAMLSMDFLKLVITGLVIAVPVAWYVMNGWLEEFAFRIGIGAGTFLTAATLIFLVALLAVAGQSLRAAGMNPATALKAE